MHVPFSSWEDYAMPWEFPHLSHLSIHNVMKLPNKNPRKEKNPRSNSNPIPKRSKNQFRRPRRLASMEVFSRSISLISEEFDPNSFLASVQTRRNRRASVDENF